MRNPPMASTPPSHRFLLRMGILLLPPKVKSDGYDKAG
jgi:hypothetical protein